MHTILIIEDDPALQELYKTTFTKAGFNLLQAFDGEEALELIEEHAEIIKVMLVDIMLPKLSGYDVIRKIREKAMTNDIPILIVSALADESDMQKGLDSGANEFITKGSMPLADILVKVRRYAES